MLTAMHRWETFEVIIAVIGFVSVLLGLIVLLSKPSRDNAKEVKDTAEKQQKVLTELQITIAELNITLKKTNELDVIRDSTLKTIDERSRKNETDITVLKKTKFKKVYE